MKMWKRIVGLCLGVLFIVMGTLVILDAEDGTANANTVFLDSKHVVEKSKKVDTGSKPSLDYASFGADFYTYTYEGIYKISRQLNGVQSALESLESGLYAQGKLLNAFGYVLLAFVAIQKALGWILVAIGTSIDVKMLVCD